MAQDQPLRNKTKNATIWTLFLLDWYFTLNLELVFILNFPSKTMYLLNKVKLQKTTLGVLYKTRHFFNEKALYLIFNSLFISNVRYGLLCWGGANKKCINDINVLINRALRCIHFKKYNDSVRELKTQKKY